MMERATICDFKNTLLLQASSHTTDGLWILSGACLKLPDGCSDEELGLALQVVLGRSQQGVPHPSEWGSLLAPLLAGAGVNSWRTFSRTASWVSSPQIGSAFEDAEQLNTWME